MLRIGIDFGGTKIEGVIMDADGAIHARERRPTPRDSGYQEVLESVRALVVDLEREAGEPCRVGIGAPGALSPLTGLLKNSNTVVLNGQPFKADLEKLLKRELRLENDANCFALSEALDGAGRGHGVVFGIILGTGVGGGIVFHRRLHPGAMHIAGEWGHNVLEANGPLCYCGNRGCVETFLSGPGLAHDYRANGGASDAGSKEVVERATAGDATAEAAMQRYFERFGRAVAGMINILDPDAVVLGGGMSNVERLYTEGRERVGRHVFAARTRDARTRLRTVDGEFVTKILQNVHGDSSGVRGAAQLWPAED